MMKVLDELKEDGFIIVYLDLFRVTSLQSFMRIYTTAIAKASVTKLDEAIQFLKDHIPTIIPKIVLKGEGTTEFELDFESGKKDIEILLDDLYDLPQKIAIKRGKRIVVVFDEFQEIITLDLPIERQLRSKIQHHDRVAYCFMGSKRHLMDELFQDKNKPLFKIAKTIPIGRILPEKLTSFIHTRFKFVHMQIESKLIDKILQITSCHPCYTQQLCHEIFNRCISNVSNKKERMVISSEDIGLAKDKCIQAQSYAYSTIWDGLTGKQKSLVLVLSLEPVANLYSQDFLIRYSLPAPATMQTAVKALVRKGILDHENGSYFVSDIFFVEWIKKKIA